jgi:hypothetical protein
MVPPMHEDPSIAALIVPWDTASALERLGRALAARGLTPHKTALPAGYKPAPNEWVGAIALPLPPLRRGRESHPNAAIVSTEVARVFTLAMWLSASQPEDVIVAWRRFSGFEPCTKVLWGGMPRWKHGEDPDHEIAFVLPQGQPAEVRPPTEPRVPLDAELITSLLVPIVKPLKDPARVGGMAWLHSSSILL